ncbi:MAG TPA: hypothetical protein PK876_03215 [Elusimicrobiota bacterium]|nr:hypothetical protein [Elusimicrobiota bacterium]
MPPSDKKIHTGVAYLGNRIVSHARRDLADIAEACDYVVHTVSETDFHYHKASLEKIFSDSHRQGLEVWADPWGLGGVFGGETFSRFLLDHPDSWQVLSDGRRVPAACLHQPAFRNFVREWILTVREMGADVLFWDEPHVYFHWDLEWAGTYSCACPLCQKLCRKQFGESLPATMNETARAFRLRSLRGFLEEMVSFARTKKLKNALCLYAFEGSDEYELIWNDLSSLKQLDVFGCDPYWRWPPRTSADPREHVTRFSKKVLTATIPLRRHSQIWIQSMRFPKGRETEIRAAVDAAARSGITHLAAWSHDGGAVLDTTLSEDPGKVWRTVKSSFQSIRS